MRDEWECAVIGGGAAGLSAALVLGRARRRTIVLDDDDQSNRAAPVIGGLLGFDRRPPAELYAIGREELTAYPSVEYRGAHVAGGRPVDNGFVLDLDDGDTVVAKRVLLTTGMSYCPPTLPGLADFWGTSVFQCPFCHGWEMRDKRLAALAHGAEAVHTALMLRGWTEDVMLLTDGRSELAPDERRLLQSAGVVVEDRRVVGLLGEDGALAAVRFADGHQIERDGILVGAPLFPRSALAEQLGGDLAPGPVGEAMLGVDHLHRTRVGGVFAAGDVCTKSPHVAGAIASGSEAAMIVVQSLLADEFGLPYPPT